jgi:hypothetical protein
MKIIKDRILVALGSSITEWIVKSSEGNSGGILVGINTFLFTIIQVWKSKFSITLLIKNTTEDFTWLLTFVYGPVLAVHKKSFLQELLNIGSFGYDNWLLGGDFNLIRKKYDKQGKSFNFLSTARFNKVLSDLHLIEMPLVDKKFTWAKYASSDTLALLDRFFLLYYLATTLFM